MRIYLPCPSSISSLAMPVYMKVRGKYIFLSKWVVDWDGVGAKRDKFGGYRQNGEKNLVEPAVKRIFAHKSEDKWK